MRHGDVAVAEDRTDEIADEIKKLSKVFTALRDSRLNRRALVLLIHDMTRVGKKDIEKLLNALPDLADHYLKPEDD
jgi:hypothetical protein